MPIPLPPSGISKSAAGVEALAQYLEAETGRSWRGGVFPPVDIDVPVGTIRPYTQAPYGTDDASSTQTLQLMFQCRTTDQDAVTATSNMMSWQAAIALSLTKLQASGVTGSYRGLDLTNALQGIEPIQMGGGGWSQIAVELSDRRPDQGQGSLVVRLLMNYQIPIARPEIEKIWLNL